MQVERAWFGFGLGLGLGFGLARDAQVELTLEEGEVGSGARGARGGDYGT